MNSEQNNRSTTELIRPIPATWWLKKRTYFLFMVRELTCVFVGGYALFLLALAGKLEDLKAFEELLYSPSLIAFQIIALPMAIYHSITWFNLTPKVMVVWRGEDKIDPRIIAGANYVACLIISIIIVCIVSRFRETS